MTSDIYTCYDFINSDISAKWLNLGWRASVFHSFLCLDYTVLNFDWKSLEQLGNDDMNKFLESKSYAEMKARLEKAKENLKRLHYEALSIDQMKQILSDAGLEIDLDKLIEKMRLKKSEEIKKRNDEVAKEQAT